MIKSLAFTQYIAEFYKFIEGFDSIIKLDNLKSLNVKQLNKLIVGDRSLNIDDFLRKLQRSILKKSQEGLSIRQKYGLQKVQFFL